LALWERRHKDNPGASWGQTSHGEVIGKHSEPWSKQIGISILKEFREEF